MNPFFSKIAGALGGSLVKEVKEVAMAYFPPSMTDADKMAAELALTQMLHQKELDIQQVLNDASKQLDKRIAEQEGTASDLKAIPVFGRFVLFLRGLQRPTWGFSCLYMDYLWFFGVDKAFTEQQQTAMIVINFLVLGFLFGERTIKNLEPLIIKVFAK